MHLRPSTDAERVARLTSLGRSGDSAELLEEIWSCREAGWSWQQVADALGVTRQAAHKRFAHRLVAGRPTRSVSGRHRNRRKQAVQAHETGYEGMDEIEHPNEQVSGIAGGEQGARVDEPRLAAETSEPSHDSFPELDELGVWPWETLEH